MGQYHYQIEKQETKTSRIVDLTKVKKTSRGGKNPSKPSKPPKWFDEFANEVRKGFITLNNHFDNLVKQNNLKE